MVKTAKIALAGLVALAAAAALFAAAGAATDGGAREPAAVAQSSSSTQPTGADWSCSTATRGHRFLGGFQRSLINHFHYEVTEQVVCRNSATSATWNGPVTRRSYWVCRQESDDAIVACPS